MLLWVIIVLRLFKNKRTLKKVKTWQEFFFFKSKKLFTSRDDCPHCPFSHFPFPIALLWLCRNFMSRIFSRFVQYPHQLTWKLGFTATAVAGQKYRSYGFLAMSALKIMIFSIIFGNTWHVRGIVVFRAIVHTRNSCYKIQYTNTHAIHHPLQYYAALSCPAFATPANK